MNINVLILHTSVTTWFAKDIPKLRAHMQLAKGVTVGRIDTCRFTHSLNAFPVKQDADGDLKFDWDAFRRLCTSQAKGYDAVVLHITRQERKWLGLTVNGSYRRDSDEIFECWFSADNGQPAEHYPMSEWLRLAMHELCGHGFERFFFGYETNYTHDYDYGPDWRDGDRSGPHILPELINIMDAREWTRLRDKRDETANRLIRILKRIYQKLLNPMIEDAMYPIAPELWRKVTQPFGVANDRYKSGMHNGADFKCPIGTPIYAPVDGQITYRGGDHPTMGGFVYFTGMFGGTRYWMRFLHLSKATPIGSYKQGDILGYTGNSGDSDGPHLHLDVWKVPINSALIVTPEGVRENLLDPVAFFNEQVDGIVNA